MTAACSSSTPAPPSAPRTVGTGHRVLFDDTKDETAGNADWIISTVMPDPTRQDAHPASATAWTGALSSWGVALQQSGYGVETLPPSGAITYGDVVNPLDLSKFDAFVLPEPNVLLTPAERAAVLAFVRAGGGLFLISDHAGSDRNSDGADSVQVLDDLMSGDPFGFTVDAGDISYDNPDVLGTSPVLHGPFGTVTGTIIRAGTTATLHPGDDPAVRGAVFRTGASAAGTSGAAVVTSTYGAGRVVFWGDSSAVDDGTGQPGNTLYDGWDDTHGSDRVLALNATAWLVH